MVNQKTVIIKSYSCHPKILSNSTFSLAHQSCVHVLHLISDMRGVAKTSNNQKTHWKITQILATSHTYLQTAVASHIRNSEMFSSNLRGWPVSFTHIKITCLDR